MTKKSSRRATRAVFIGQVGLGGQFPIRVQSMTTSDTKDTVSIVRETADLVRAGCEIVRVTVPTKADADNLPNIRKELAAAGLKVPLVADIHFTPSIAMQVVDYVEKVRINPGNFVDKKLFKTFEISDDDYAGELVRIEEKFTPLVLKCKDRGVAMRIGTNHGSLSDRIMNRYGDTPLGMVESALEFVRIAAKNNYHDIVLSMKASNPQVMVAAYRLLVDRLDSEGFNYPLHLGVTEAGDGEDGRVKSAVGIGTLLEDGIGDTIRVSLTEDSIHEIPVAAAIVAPYNQRHAFYDFARASGEATAEKCAAVLPEPPKRLGTKASAGKLSWGNGLPPTVWTALNGRDINALVQDSRGDLKAEGVLLTPSEATPQNLAIATAAGMSCGLVSDNAQTLHEANEIISKRSWNILSFLKYLQFDQIPTKLVTSCKTHDSHLELRFDANSPLFTNENLIKIIKELETLFQKIDFDNYSYALASHSLLHDGRRFAKILTEAGSIRPITWVYQAGESPAQLDAATQIGGLFIDGLGDAVELSSNESFANDLSLAYGILQATRRRISKTEFIACPSCGRTQFSLQEVTARIRARTAHLKGLKIAIMGCIVNGPGEMADADFGYVGTGVGKISLYVGKDCVERNIAETEALDRLVDLIKKHDKWVDAA